MKSQCRSNFILCSSENYDRLNSMCSYEMAIYVQFYAALKVIIDFMFWNRATYHPEPRDVPNKPKV